MKVRIILLPTLVLFVLFLAQFYPNNLSPLSPYSKNIPNTQHYDVVVIGGEPEGVAAAVSAARNGANTLLVEKRDGLGGLMTYGMLNYIDMVYGINNQEAIGGIFQEWHQLVGKDFAFPIEQGKKAFLQLAEGEENLTLLFDTHVIAPIMDKSNVKGLALQTTDRKILVSADRFIDATLDADIAALAGAPYFVGGADINLNDRKMAVTIMIHLDNVNWEGVKRAVTEETFGKAWITESVAWGFGDLHYDYKPREENTRLRGLNLARVINEQGEEEFFINALQIFEVDGLSESSKKEGLERGKRETEHVVQFLQREFPGFEQARIKSFPEELYVRETRHLESEYMLSMKDIWTNSDQWDGIAYGGYPVDVQATSIHDYGSVASSPVQYSIPFRSLVPLKVENLLVVGRSAGYSSIASGSARIIPTGMATGEAAGVAAKLSIEEGKSFRNLAYDKNLIDELKNRLASQGAKVAPFEIPYPYEGEWFDDSLQFLLSYGLISGGYDNNLHVDEPITKKQFASIVVNGLNRVGKENQQLEDRLISWLKEGAENEEACTRDELASHLLLDGESAEDSGHLWETAHHQGLVDEYIFQMINENKVLTKKDGYYIAAQLLQRD